jgi:hypothetical protein
VGWQIDRLRALGFTGRVHLPVAGRGVLPADRAAAVAALLDGRNDPDGALERGLDYPAIFAAWPPGTTPTGSTSTSPAWTT